MLMVGLCVKVNDVEAFGSAHAGNYLYIVVYDQNDDYYCRTFSRLKNSVVTVGFSTKPWTDSATTSIQNKWFEVENKDTTCYTLVNTRFDNYGVPQIISLSNGVGLPPNMTTY